MNKSKLCIVFLAVLVASCGSKQKKLPLEWELSDNHKREVFICVRNKSKTYHLTPHCKAIDNCEKIMLSTDERAESNGYELCGFEK